MSESAPDAPLHYSCPGCQVDLHASAADAGRRRKCPQCGKTIKVPGIPVNAKQSSTSSAGKPAAATRAGTPQSPRILFPCPHCQNKMIASTGQTGQSMICEECLETVEVPSAPATPNLDRTVPQPATPPSPDPASEEQPATQWKTQDTPSTQPNNQEADEVIPESFAVICAVCSTRLYANKSQIGSRIPCPDCHSTTQVRSPKPVKKQPPKPADNAPVVPLGKTDHKDRDARKDVAEMALAAAEKEIHSEQDIIRERDSKSRFQNLFGFLLLPDILLRLVSFSLLMTLTIFLYRAAGQYSAGIMAALGLLLTIAGLVTGVIAFLTALPNCVVITIETANGNYEINDLPGINFMDGFGYTLYMLTTLLLCAVPYLLLSYLLDSGGSGNALTQVLIQIVCACFFPLLLLSALEAQSPVLIWSPVILESIGDRADCWIEFWVTTALLLAVRQLLDSLILPSLPLRTLLSSTLTITVVLLYFRAMGLLAWQASKIFNQEPS
ncbi:MAG: hypothetical protein GY917_31925 [Planctomycetaceae bacterium]|nr:hypothetical protein [Planctomycetaceae bacterium]